MTTMIHPSDYTTFGNTAKSWCPGVMRYLVRELEDASVIAELDNSTGYCAEVTLTRVIRTVGGYLGLEVKHADGHSTIYPLRSVGTIVPLESRSSEVKWSVSKELFDLSQDTIAEATRLIVPEGEKWWCRWDHHVEDIGLMYWRAVRYGRETILPEGSVAPHGICSTSVAADRG